MGRIRLVAGNGETYTGLGDGGPAVRGRIDVEEVSGLASDGAGNLYISDSANHRIRRIDAATTPRQVLATGWNGFGQLGDGSTTGRQTFTATLGLQNVRSVAAGNYHSVAVRADGTVWSWGWNAFGQLGDGTTTDRRLPTQVKGLRDVVTVAAGPYHNLALRADGTVWSWGWNGVGQLGDGTTLDRHAPVRVAGLAGVKALAAGGFHSMALTHDGGVSSWGWNVYGQLGTSSAAAMGLTPVRIPGSSGATSIAAGALHSLAEGLVGGDGTVWSWGWNGLGQLGDGTTTDRRTPARVAAWGEVSAGGYHSFAGLPGPLFQAWGWNALGQLGKPTLDAVVARPMYVDFPRIAVDVAPGLAHNVSVGLGAAIETWDGTRSALLATGPWSTGHDRSWCPGSAAGGPPPEPCTRLSSATAWRDGTSAVIG